MKKTNILQLHFIIHVFVIIEFSMRTLQSITRYDMRFTSEFSVSYVSASFIGLFACTLTSAMNDNANAHSINISCRNLWTVCYY